MPSWIQLRIESVSWKIVKVSRYTATIIDLLKAVKLLKDKMMSQESHSPLVNLHFSSTEAKKGVSIHLRKHYFKKYLPLSDKYDAFGNSLLLDQCSFLVSRNCASSLMEVLIYIYNTKKKSPPFTVTLLRLPSQMTFFRKSIPMMYCM